MPEAGRYIKAERSDPFGFRGCEVQGRRATLGPSALSHGSRQETRKHGQERVRGGQLASPRKTLLTLHGQ